MISPGIHPVRLGDTVKAIVLSVTDAGIDGLRAVGYFRFGDGTISPCDWNAETGRYARDGGACCNDILINEAVS